MDRFDRYWIGDEPLVPGTDLAVSSRRRIEQTAVSQRIPRSGADLCLLHNRHLASQQRSAGGSYAVYIGGTYRLDVMISAAVAEAG